MQHPNQIPGCTGFANAQLRQEHYNNHPNDFGNAVEYERQGIWFMNQARDAVNQSAHPEDLYTFVRPNGDLVAIYWDGDDARGIFGSMTGNGVLRTFFGILSAQSFTKLFLSHMGH